MSFSQFLAVVRARRFAALAVFALTLLVTLVLSLVLPKQYTASASVVADNKADPIGGALLQGASSSFVATQVDVLQSDRVALRAVSLMKLADSPKSRQQWMDETGGAGSIESWLAESLQKRLLVKPSRDSNVITVSFTALDPNVAATVANAVVQAYLDTSLELKVDPARQYSSFFESRAKEARNSLEAAQNKLSNYQQSAGIVATDERLDVENSRLAELSSQLVALQALAAESGSRSQQAVSSAERLPEVLNNPLIASLKAELARSDARLKELSSRLGDNHPSVQELRANITETRERIEQEVKRISGSIGVNNNVNRQREADVQASLNAQREKVLKLKASRDQLNVLQKDVENAQRAYDAVIARLNQTSLESQTTQSNISVLTTALPPSQASSPRVFLNMVLATIVGLLLAVAAAVGAEQLDRRLRCHEDVIAALGLPVIGVMLRPGARSRLSRYGAARSARQRFFGALEEPSTGA